jgi:Protein of unknown function (DUF559)
VNNHGGFGRWCFLEIADPWDGQNFLRSTFSLGETSGEHSVSSERFPNDPHPPFGHPLPRGEGELTSMSDRDQNTPFSEHMKARARQLRRDLTGPERVLWQVLRAGRLDGWKIRRQVPFGPYVVDFFCHASSLAIEIDGDSHIDRAAPDLLL